MNSVCEKCTKYKFVKHAKATKLHVKPTFLFLAFAKTFIFMAIKIGRLSTESHNHRLIFINSSAAIHFEFPKGFFSRK